MRVLPPLLVILLATAPALADVDSFKTPSGNIDCSGGVDYGVPSDIECTIYERSNSPTTPRPKCKDAVEFSMRERGTVKVKCASHAVSLSSDDQIVQYGGIRKFGGIVCRSSKSGLECRNADGHGFSLSRLHQAMF